MRTLVVVAMLIVAPRVGLSLTIDMAPQGPVTTLVAARDAARLARDKGEKGPITIRIADGSYPIDSPLVLEPRDSDVTYEAAQGAHPLINGGRRLTGFKAGPDGVWTLRIPQVQQGRWYFESLWVNGQRAIRARTPNAGYLMAVAIGDKPVIEPMGGDAGHTLLRMEPKDIECLKGLSPAELRDVNAVAYHTWDVNRQRIAAIRSEDGTLQFTGGASRPFFNPEPSQRVCLENFRGALDAPGEWFLARDGLLSYIPRPGETPDQAEVWAPLAERWVVFAGDPKTGQFVTDVQFRGLRFSYQSYALPDQGACLGQAEHSAGAAIEANGAREIVFDHCEMAHTLTNAAWFQRGCQNITLRHCRLHDLGAGGVKIGDPRVKDDGPEQSSHVTIDDCIIHGGGRYFIGAIGVTAFHAHDCIVRHCDIADFFYTAISLGWTWGYHPTAAGHNLIESCALHHLGQGVLSDMGGVYTLGPQPGTVIRGCDIHDIWVSSYGGWGMYNDEGSTGIVWENNLVHHTQHAAYHMHYGRGDIVRNNILADCAEEQLRRSRPEDQFAFALEHNIVLVTTARLFAPDPKNWTDGRIDLNHNLYWGLGGPPKELAGENWANWNLLGRDTGSVLADPMFVNSAGGDWTLRPESPALKIGFVPFDWRAAGVDSTDAAWRVQANESMPEMKILPKIKGPPLSLHDGFEETALGGKPAHAWCSAPIASSIQVVADRPSRGAHCLMLTDGPEIKPFYDPHFFYSPAHDHGITDFAFDVRAEPAYDLAVEWRDNNDSYRVGPRLEVHDGAIRVGGQKLLDIPPDAWTHVEMIAALGPDADASWTAIITIAGQTPHVVEHLKFADPKMKTLDWLGFSSLGTMKARCWLDEIEIENKAKSATKPN